MNTPAPRPPSAQDAMSRATSKGSANTITIPGVRLRTLGGKVNGTAMVCRILPSNHYTHVDANGVFRASDPMGWTHYRDPQTMELSNWFEIVGVSRYNGRDWQRRTDFVDQRVFGPGERNAVDELYAHCENTPDFAYLIAKPETQAQGAPHGAPQGIASAGQGAASNARRGAMLNRMAPCIFMNITEYNNPRAGDTTQLVMLTKSAIESINTLVNQSNPNPNPEEPLSIYTYWRMTDPSVGYAFNIYQDAGKGTFGEYVVEPAIDQATRRMQVRPVTADNLRDRIPLLEHDRYLVRMSLDKQVRALADMFSQRSPSGVHEHDLLNYLFPGCGIAAPAPAPGAMRTVAVGGFPMGAGVMPGPSTGGGALPGPATGGIPPPGQPHQGFPQAPAPQQPAQGFPQAPAPQQPAQGFPQAPATQQPAQGFPQAPAPQQPAQGFPQAQAPQQRAPLALPSPAGALAAHGGQQEQPGQRPDLGVTQTPQAALGGPVLPGDRPFDASAFRAAATGQP